MIETSRQLKDPIRNLITPREIRYSFKLMLEDRSIEVLASVSKEVLLRMERASI